MFTRSARRTAPAGQCSLHSWMTLLHSIMVVSLATAKDLANTHRSCNLLDRFPKPKKNATLSLAYHDSVGAVRVETDFQLQIQFGPQFTKSDISKPPSSFGFCARGKPEATRSCRRVADQTASEIRHTWADWRADSVEYTVVILVEAEQLALCGRSLLPTACLCKHFRALHSIIARI